MKTSKLRIFKTLRAAILEVWRNRGFLLAAAALPLAAGTALIFVGSRGMGGELGALLLSVGISVVAASFAFWAHRCVVAERVTRSELRSLPRGMPEFVGWAVGGLLLISLFQPPPSELSSEDLEALQRDMSVNFARAVGVFTATYCLARASMVFPSCALGGRGRPDVSWQLTQRNGWRIVLASFLVYGVAIIPSIFLYPPLEELAAAGPRPFAGMPSGQLFLLSLTQQLGILVGTAVEASFLSLSFLSLSGAEARRTA